MRLEDSRDLEGKCVWGSWLAGLGYLLPPVCAEVCRLVPVTTVRLATHRMLVGAGCWGLGDRGALGTSPAESEESPVSWKDTQAAGGRALGTVKGPRERGRQRLEPGHRLRKVPPSWPWPS